MGRGLSDLQKDVLCLAYQNMIEEGREPLTWRVDFRVWPLEEESGSLTDDRRIERRLNELRDGLPLLWTGYQERIDQYERWKEFTEENNLKAEGRYREANLSLPEVKHDDPDMSKAERGDAWGFGTVLSAPVGNSRRLCAGFFDNLDQAKQLTESIEDVGFPAGIYGEISRWYAPGDFNPKSLDLYPPEAIAHCYDLEERLTGEIRTEHGQLNGGNLFDRSGAKDEFNRASASVSRTFDRLDKRGLCSHTTLVTRQFVNEVTRRKVNHKHSGIRLTNDGAEKAEELLDADPTRLQATGVSEAQKE